MGERMGRKSRWFGWRAIAYLNARCVVETGGEESAAMADEDEGSPFAKKDAVLSIDGAIKHMFRTAMLLLLVLAAVPPLYFSTAAVRVTSSVITQVNSSFNNSTRT